MFHPLANIVLRLTPLVAAHLDTAPVVGRRCRDAQTTVNPNSEVALGQLMVGTAFSGRKELCKSGCRLPRGSAPERRGDGAARRPYPLRISDSAGLGLFGAGRILISSASNLIFHAAGPRFRQSGFGEKGFFSPSSPNPPSFFRISFLALFAPWRETKFYFSPINCWIESRPVMWGYHCLQYIL
jgi:hypothetical protein